MDVYGKYSRELIWGEEEEEEEEEEDFY